MKMNGSQMVCESLIREGVDVIFGLPGGAILPLYQTLPEFPQLRHILVRHEQGAAHAADGYARVTGRPGVAWATSGPGATNLVTGIATAQMDSIPMVIITGQVARAAIGSDAFQETDTTGITLPITKHNYLVMNAADIPARHQGGVPHSQHRKARPRPRGHPQGRAAWRRPSSSTPTMMDLPGYKPTHRRSPRPDKEGCQADRGGQQRPVILAGHGIIILPALTTRCGSWRKRPRSP